jgi:hypothetical protein
LIALELTDRLGAAWPFFPERVQKQLAESIPAIPTLLRRAKPWGPSGGGPASLLGVLLLAGAGALWFSGALSPGPAESSGGAALLHAA